VSTDNLWPSLSDSLRHKVSDAAWNSGLNRISFVDFDNDQLILGVDNEFQQRRIQQSYQQLISDAAQQITGRPVSLSFQILHSAVTSLHDPIESVAPVSSVPFVTTLDRPSRLDPRMTFESFVAGPSNQLAYAAAQSVAEAPGRNYNPLMIYGNSGLGKTHLLHAIGNFIQENYPGKKVLYVSTETFLNDFIRAIQTKTQVDLHDRYREIDVLLIDDIQFMESRGETFHEEIFHTYNSLHGAGKQVVLTSDRTPRDLAGLQERFRSRLMQGLVAEIEHPDLETRIAILRAKAEREGVVVTNEVAEWIAQRARNNIRELEGSITMLKAFSNLHQVPITIDLARAHLTNLGQEQITLKPESVLQAVSAYYGLSVEEIKGEKRLRALVHARHVAMFLMRELLQNYSYPMIASVMGGRNHTTVMSAVEKINEKLAHDADLLAEVTQLRKKLQAE
jgi:chromosomal replication initiator protein